LAVLLCVVPAADARRALYATDAANGRTFGFAVGATGLLSGLPSFPILGATGSSAFAMSRDATHLYQALAASSSVRTYAVSSTGTLTLAPGSTPTGAAPAAIAATPSGNQMFVANSGSDTISRYEVGAGGSLTALAGDAATGPSPDALAITPNGAKLYAANGGGDSISIYTLGSDGSLTVVGTPVAAGDHPGALSVTPDGKFLYAANSGDATITGWAVSSDGSLTPVQDSPFAAGTGVNALAISPDGSHLLAGNPGSSTISRYQVGSAGSLTSLGTTDGPSGVESIAISPDGKHAYAGGTATLATFDLSAGGDLSSAGSPLATNGDHDALAMTPDQPPRAGFSVVSKIGTVVRFAGAATDDDGSPASYKWNFGDGSTGTGQNVSHTYQAGTYDVTLTVTDDEGCSTTAVFTGQSLLCAGGSAASFTASVTVAGFPGIPDDPPCLHDGNDGFCGTPDQKAPVVNVLGFSDGASIAVIDAPEDIVGTVTPDPSTIKEIRLRFTKAAGTIVKKTAVTRKVCRKVKGTKRCKRRPVYRKTCKKVHGKRRCTRKKVVKLSGSRIPVCLTVSGTKNYLVRYICSKVPWITLNGDTTFRYSLPVALGVGSYAVDVIAVDGAGNEDVLEPGRNHMTFSIVKTPSNQGGTDTTGGGGGSDSSPTTPIDDTGSPFG
jgi:6-phosphogluconolactonase (cycloisomerase 2 family)